MSARLAVLVVAAFAAGFAVASLVRSGDSPGSLSMVNGVVGLSASSGKQSDLVASLQNENSVLKKELKALRRGVSIDQGNPLVAVQTTEERIQAQLQLLMRGVEEVQKMEVQKLLAAGFSMDRIDWIRKRADELQATYRQYEDELQRSGKAPDHDKTLSHYSDPDIDLRFEIGDAEYEKYRAALGRSVGAKVMTVFPGGAGERGGLKGGDEIVAYNGARIFNVGELNPLLRQYAGSGASMGVDVVRDGQRMRVYVAAGDLRIVPVPPVMALGEEVKSRERFIATGLGK